MARLTAALADRYRIERELGQGGMATVYLAEDLKHKRKVALKVLKPELAAVLGAERFVVEITTTAALQHPHILPLFDSGTADGFLYYVMPYIKGETIREKLNRESQCGVEESVRIAREIADALDYAHRNGIIHRDIKPENILLHDGRAMVMDFGIALAVSAAAGGRMTETGLSLGTPHYMSPEQATAEKDISARSDVYSLGSVLYEMLTGQPPHLGGSAQQIIMKIITEPAEPVTKHRKSVPPNVAAAVAKSLEKLPADRFESAKAFADALGNPAYATVEFSGAIASRGRRRVFTRPFLGVAVLALVALVGWVWSGVQLRRAPRPEDDAVIRATLAMSGQMQFLDYANGTNVAISPQGDLIAFAAAKTGSGGNALWLRATDDLEYKMLSATGAVRMPCFSPDGRWIAFVEGNTIKKVSVDGGSVIPLATMKNSPFGLSWGIGGTLVVGDILSGLWILPEQGGEPRLIPAPTGEANTRWPLFLADGTSIAYSSELGGVRRLSLASATNGGHTSLGVPGSAPLAVLQGRLIYVTQLGALMAVGFDGRRVGTDAPVPLVQNVLVDPFGAAKAAVSALSGTLVYRSGSSETEPVIVGRAINPLGAGVQNFMTPRYSPDGKRVAYAVSSSQSTDVWVYDRARGTKTKVTSVGSSNQRPEWSPDGKRLIFVSDRGGQSAVWWQIADGSGAAELLYKPEQGDPYEAVMSPDGKWLVYRTGPGGNPPRSIFAVRLDGERKSTLMVGGPSYNVMPRLSPDEHWLAYQSNETGEYEIYVRPFPESGGRITISAGGGTEPMWSRDGRSLYYRRGNDVIAVRVTTGATLGVGERTVVATGNYVTNPSHPNYDVSPTGTEVLMLRHAGEEALTILVHHWGREVAALTATRRGK